MCQISDAITFLESKSDLGLAEKVAEIKKKCKEEHGLTVENPEMRKIEKFIKWMRDGGAKFKGIKMRYYGPDYRGVHTSEAIAGGDIFLSVPSNLIITPQSGRECEIGKLVLKSGVKVNWDYLVYITIFLIDEMKNPNSKWKPYLDVYPKLANNFPIFYNEYERSLLKGTPMLEHIVSEYNLIKDEYNRICSAVPEFKKFTAEEYIRNKILVVSRIFYVKMHGVAERIMVPLAGIFLYLNPLKRYV